MAITILIVDDDKLLVDKLEETVNWSKIGIDMVFNIKTAEDKSTGKYRTERKETMGRSSDPVYAGRILDRAGKKEI